MNPSSAEYSIKTCLCQKIEWVYPESDKKNHVRHKHDLMHSFFLNSQGSWQIRLFPYQVVRLQDEQCRKLKATIWNVTRIVNRIQYRNTLGLHKHLVRQKSIPINGTTRIIFLLGKPKTWVNCVFPHARQFSPHTLFLLCHQTGTKTCYFHCDKWLSIDTNSVPHHIW